jgi:hypothetical protein
LGLSFLRCFLLVGVGSEKPLHLPAAGVPVVHIASLVALPNAVVGAVEGGVGAVGVVGGGGVGAVGVVGGGGVGAVGVVGVGVGATGMMASQDPVSWSASVAEDVATSVSAPTRAFLLMRFI